MSEPPFRPREKLLEKQKYFQSVHRHTYLKGPYDKITSVAIPLALAATSLCLIGRGLYNLVRFCQRKESHFNLDLFTRRAFTSLHILNDLLVMFPGASFHDRE